MNMTKRPKLVHYISPFGSPAWMTREEAERYRTEDDRVYEELCAAERETGHRVLSEYQRQIGPPRIEVPR